MSVAVENSKNRSTLQFYESQSLSIALALLSHVNVVAKSHIKLCNKVDAITIVNKYKCGVLAIVNN